jgi:tripartite-type tricarboxylate transporter receptor subunit TctC
MTGVQIVRVPRKGGAASSADLAGGQVQLLTNLPERVAYIKSGRTRALGVSTVQRSPQFPDVPSISETVPGYEVTVWYGLCGPGSMPRPLVERINADLVKTVTSPETAKRLADVGIEAAPNTPEQFAAFARAEVAKWAKVVKEAGITATEGPTHFAAMKVLARCSSGRASPLAPSCASLAKYAFAFALSPERSAASAAP